MSQSKDYEKVPFGEVQDAVGEPGPDGERAGGMGKSIHYKSSGVRRV